MHKAKFVFLLALFCVGYLANASAQEELSEEEQAAALAQKLANPIAALSSVPFQFNYDQDIGPEDDGSRITMNFQPVLPFSLNDDWNVISRTILPVIDQEDIFPGAGGQTGLGDTVQSLFFSPKLPNSKGWVWGVGPVFLLPTGTDDLLSAEKWGAGPTAVALKQSGPWTKGMLVNHIWSFAGDSDRSDVNSTFIQPFLSFNTPKAWTYTVNLETTYNWETEEWNVPINLVASKVTRFGSQLVSVGGGLRYYLESTDGGPEGLGVRFFVTLLFPRR